MESRQALLIAAVAAVLGVVTGALAMVSLLRLNGEVASAELKQPGWSELAWPFPIDQFGRGKAYQCDATVCGSAVTLYVRAKIGFCNCTTGVADDAELERIGDLDLLGDKREPLDAGRPIAVAWMKGRSRPYSFNERSGPSALSIGYNDRCDAIVATAVVQRERPGDIEPAVIQFLNTPVVMRWLERTLGL